MGRKRKNGEGTVRLRKDGRWEGQVVIGYDNKGLPKTKNILARTKGECVEKLNALKNSVTPTATVKVRADMLFGEWMAFGMRQAVNLPSSQTRGQATKIISACTSGQGSEASLSTS